jgi:hypothetical protein
MSIGTENKFTVAYTETRLEWLASAVAVARGLGTNIQGKLVPSIPSTYTTIHGFYEMQAKCQVLPTDQLLNGIVCEWHNCVHTMETDHKCLQLLNYLK